jgi:hypothetical protein
MLQRPKNFIENQGEMLQRSDISKKFAVGSREWPSATFYFTKIERQQQFKTSCLSAPF